MVDETSSRSKLDLFQKFKANTDKDDASNTPSSLSSPLGPKVATIIEAHSSKIHNDSFLKIIRQLQFWHGQQTLKEEEFVALTERLCKIAIWRGELGDEDDKFTIPKVRFGKTEVMIPIVTCWGQRVQETWIPDNIPLIKPNKAKVIKSDSQANIREVILNCLKCGLNHFETARLYGSSEIQFVTALAGLIEDGTIRREDFIFQTKVHPYEKMEQFVKEWEASWSNVHMLGYVDLSPFTAYLKVLQTNHPEGKAPTISHQISKRKGRSNTLDSTHGSAETIMRMINSEKFSYVNIHKHYFGDYHAAGTPDTQGGEGNELAV